MVNFGTNNRKPTFSRRGFLGAICGGTFFMSTGCSSNDDVTPTNETRSGTTGVTEITTDPHQQSIITTESVGPTTISHQSSMPPSQPSTPQPTVTKRTNSSLSVSSRSTSETSPGAETTSELLKNPTGTGAQLSSTTHASSSIAESTTTPRSTLAASTPTVTATSTTKAIPSPSTPLLTGAYIGESGSYSYNLELFKNWLDHSPALTMEFVEGLRSEDVVSQFLSNRMTPIWEAGSIPVITWLPSTGTIDETSSDIARDIADGVHDGLLETWASKLGDWTTDDDIQRRFYFRPGHEMNGNWFPWSAADSSSTTDDYIEMWQHIHTIFTADSLDETTIQWVWSPNADEIGGIRAEEYYPGDDFVDWVGLDGFNFGDSQSYSQWRTPEEIFGPMLERIRELTEKPVSLPEVASSSFREGDPDPSAKAMWVRRLFSFVDDQDIRMVNWFNAEKSGPDESDWAVFGGERGTDTYEIDGDAYATYGAYRATVSSPSVIHGSIDTSSRLTDREFRGEL